MQNLFRKVHSTTMRTLYGEVTDIVYIYATAFVQLKNVFVSIF